MDNDANTLPVPESMREESAQHWEDSFDDCITKCGFEFVDIEEISFRLEVDVGLNLELPFVAQFLRHTADLSYRAHATPGTDPEQPSCVTSRDMHTVNTISGNWGVPSPVVASAKTAASVSASPSRDRSTIQTDFDQQYKKCIPGKK